MSIAPATRRQHDHVAWFSEVCGLAGRSVRPGSTRARRSIWPGSRSNAGTRRALHQLGAVYAHADPPDVAQAEAHYHQALTLANELGMRPLVAHCHHSLGTLYGTLGRREQARVELSATIELYRAMDMTFWLPQAEVALAQVEEASAPQAG